MNEIPLPDGRKFRITRNQLFLLPKGAIRFRIEFYKTKTISLSTGKDFTDFNVLADTGIGFYGTAKFNQWTYGGVEYNEREKKGFNVDVKRWKYCI
ncbi:hypothetical protein ACT7DA_20835 [Bacillus pacificus]